MGCIDNGKTSILPSILFGRWFHFTHSGEGRPLKIKLLSVLRRLAVAVPFFLLAVVVLAFLAGPVKQDDKRGGVRTHAEQQPGGAADAGPAAP
jgi:hypothetical protein